MRRRREPAPTASNTGLEVLSSAAAPSDRRPTPLLFVHGAFSSASIWTPFFLPYFAARGYDSHALNLRGHGGSDGRRHLATARLSDYVEDVATVARRFEVPPVVIGTSMGGVVVQKYIERYPASGAVLLGSGPPHGMLVSGWWMMVTNPRLVLDMTLMQWMGPTAATVASARRALFRDDTPDDYIQRWLPMAEPESALVMMDLLAFDLPSSIREIDVPVAVMGGARDAFISQGAVRATAGRYGVKPLIFEEMPHAMMLDPNWREVADAIGDWVDAIGSPAKPRSRRAA